MHKTHFSNYTQIIKDAINDVNNIDVPSTRYERRIEFIDEMIHRRKKLEQLNRNYSDVKMRVRRLRYPNFITPLEKDSKKPSVIFKREHVGHQFSLLDSFLFKKIAEQKQIAAIEIRVIRECSKQLSP